MNDNEKHSTEDAVEDSLNLGADEPKKRNESPLAWLLPLVLLGLLLLLGYWYFSSSAA